MKHITGKMKFECWLQREEGILEQWGEPELGVHLSFNVFPQRYVGRCLCLHLCFLKEMLRTCLSPIMFPTRIIAHVCVSNRLSMYFLFVLMCFLKATLNMFVVAGWQKLRGSTGGTRRKVWTRTKILSPNIRHFVTN